MKFLQPQKEKKSSSEQLRKKIPAERALNEKKNLEKYFLVFRAKKKILHGLNFPNLPSKVN